MTVWTRGGSHYEVVLPLVIVVVVLTPLDNGTTRPLTVALLGTIFVFSFWTSGASRRMVLLVAGVVIAAVIVAAIGQFAGRGVAARPVQRGGNRPVPERDHDDIRAADRP